MVKKLFKHEVLAYMRILPIVWGILLGVAVLGRLIQVFEYDGVPYHIINGSAIFMYVVAVLGTMVFPLIFGVQRFYKNLFTGEGYLSFTLPVTPAQHIWVKLLTAVLVSVCSVLVGLVSLAVITAGDVLTELLKAAEYLIRTTLKDEHMLHIILYVAEFLLLLLVACFSEFLLFYTCIAIGQTFKKNRVLGAVGVYVIYYVICQIIGTIFTVFFSVVSVEFMDQIGLFIVNHLVPFIHCLLCGMTVFTAVVAMVYFLITHSIIRKKLNLE